MGMVEQVGAGVGDEVELQRDGRSIAQHLIDPAEAAVPAADVPVVGLVMNRVEAVGQDAVDEHARPERHRAGHAEEDDRHVRRHKRDEEHDGGPSEVTGVLRRNVAFAGSFHASECTANTQCVSRFVVASLPKMGRWPRSLRNLGP